MYTRRESEPADVVRLGQVFYPAEKRAISVAPGHPICRCRGASWVFTDAFLSAHAAALPACWEESTSRAGPHLDRGLQILTQSTERSSMHTARMPRVLLGPGEKASEYGHVPSLPLHDDAAGRELRRTLVTDEQVLTYALGTGGAMLVATDWRAIIIKAGAAATGTWLGKQNTSFRYGQIASIDLYTGTLGDGSYAYSCVVITSVGEKNPPPGRSRDPTDLIKAKNVCPFNLLSEASVRHVVEIIRSRLYAPPR